ncbi:serine hydrolase domain-containing protein [Aliikangiella coralliicola]|nr:serine hydrolase domain-containing protein [Aliikangiella coralliicola]
MLRKRHFLFSLIGCWLVLKTMPILAIENRADRFVDMVERLDQIQKQHNIPAYALVISDPQKVIFDQVRGVAESGSSEPVSQNAYFRIGSITKTFVALSALVAESQGKLKLDENIFKYLKKTTLKNKFEKDHPITIAQLLEHSAGLTDMSKQEFDSNDVVTLEQGLRRFESVRKTLWQPGTFNSYSNTGYGLAGRVLEVAMGADINTVVTQLVFKPLEMSTATLIRSKNVKSQLVPGYQSDGTELIPYWNMIYPSLGAINLRPRDMGKLLQLYLARDSEIITAKMLHRQENPEASLAAQNGLSYGYGPGLYQWYRNGYRFYGHGGDADGYLSHFGYQKDAKLGYFFVINTFNNRAKRAMKRVIENFLIQELPKAQVMREVKSQLPRKFEGAYQSVTQRFFRPSFNLIQLRWQRGRLYINEGDEDWQPLIYLGNGLFRRTFESQPSLIIFNHEDKTFLVGDEGNYQKRVLSE